MKIIVLLLCCHAASAVTHSLKYFYTSSSGVPNFPEFVSVGMVDEVQMIHCDSNTQRAVPKQDWMDKATADLPQYWERSTGICVNNQQSFKADIYNLKKRFNQTGGVHILQYMYGCELDDDGTTLWYMQLGYDGEDFISLDKNTLTWTAANQKAFITKLKWEETVIVATRWKYYLENTCIEWLKKYVNYGKDTLGRKVPPSVSLFQRTPSSPVTCHATGFYPDGVMMFWQRDGQDHHEDVHLGQTLPNHDGTFQIRSTLDVSAEELEKHNYTCVVQHSSDSKDIFKHVKTTGPDPEGTSSGIIIGVVAVALVALIAVIGLLLWKKFKKPSQPNFTPANTDEDSHASSDTALKT